jgi:hypothetical protein
MKKMQNKLGVAKETIRTLTLVALQEVVGGVNPSGTGNSCVRTCTSDQTALRM